MRADTELDRGHFSVELSTNYHGKACETASSWSSALLLYKTCLEPQVRHLNSVKMFSAHQASYKSHQLLFTDTFHFTWNPRCLSIHWYLRPCQGSCFNPILCVFDRYMGSPTSHYPLIYCLLTLSVDHWCICQNWASSRHHQSRTAAFAIHSSWWQSCNWHDHDILCLVCHIGHSF